jgi:GAF domain-containing protein
LNELLRLNCELTQADAGTIMVLDRPSEMLVFDVVRGAAAVKLQNFRMSVQEGIAGWVARNGKALLVPDVSQDSRFSAKVSRKIHYEAGT